MYVEETICDNIYSVVKLRVILFHDAESAAAFIGDCNIEFIGREEVVVTEFKGRI